MTTKDYSNMRTTIELSGVKISISARFVEFDKPNWDDKEWHPHFRITVRSDRTQIHDLLKPRSHTYDYWGSRHDYTYNKQELDERDLLECLSMLFADASAYDCNRDFVDFCNEFGYEKMSDYEHANRAYKGCEQAHKACERLFGRFYGSVHNDLEEYINQLCNE